MLESVVAGYPDLDLGIHIVWAPMLGSDNEEAAREISKMFDDPRVKQYWDANRLCGTAYSRDVFPNHLKDMSAGLKSTLPADHWWRDIKRDWENAKPENAPLWDVAFFYPAGARWTANPPAPTGVVKQFAYYGAQGDDATGQGDDATGQGDHATGMFFAGFKQPPRDGDWIEEVASAMTRLTGKEPEKSTATPDSPPPPPLANCAGGGMKAKLIALKLTGVAESKMKAVEDSVAAMKDVVTATYDADSELLTVLASAEGSLTSDRIIKFLALAGYAAREASEGETEQALQTLQTFQTLQGGGAMVILRPMKAREPNYPDTVAGLMAQGFIEAFNSSDPEEVRAAAEASRSESSLEGRSMDERIEQYQQLYKDWGQLAVRSFEEHDDGSLTLTVKPDRGYSSLSMHFSFEKASGKIDEIRIMPVMQFDESGDDAGTGVAGDVTVLTESLEPLREHFNTHKDKHRFIAILSPT